MPFISIEDGTYYDGDRANLLDIEVPTRPTPYHIYNKNMRQWILDNNKVMQLKKDILAQLDENLKAKTILMNLTSEQKEEARQEYNAKLEILSSTNDPIKLQELLIGI